MSLELSKSGMGPDISVKSGEFLPLGTFSEDERKKDIKKERKKERKKEFLGI